jgi:hypothetical protein
VKNIKCYFTRRPIVTYFDFIIVSHTQFLKKSSRIVVMFLSGLRFGEIRFGTGFYHQMK